MTPVAKKIYEMLVNAQYAVPQPYRSQAHWVMNEDWAEVCRLIGKEIDGHEPPRRFSHLLGQPVDISDFYGDDFPHLVPDAP